MPFCFTLPLGRVAVYRGRVFGGFQHLSTSPETKFLGEVERRRSGVREGGGRA